MQETLVSFQSIPLCFPYIYFLENNVALSQKIEIRFFFSNLQMRWLLFSIHPQIMILLSLRVL